MHDIKKQSNGERYRPYDYLVVGAGLFGCVFAHESRKAGYRCLVIDKRSHVGGNTFCVNEGGINVHQYGAHIFHTNDERIWDYVNSFVRFNRYVNSPLANYKGKLYNLPFNMNTFYQLWGVRTPDEARKKIQEQVNECFTKRPKNLEEQALSLVGLDIYQQLIKGYTEKQWGRAASELPPNIIKRIPLRFTFDNNYFNDCFQGVPMGGYNCLTNALLNGVEIRTETDYLKDRAYFNGLASKIVYTGPLDAFFDFDFGRLEYRSLSFKHKKIDTTNYQGNAVVNYTDFDIPYTRIIEHKHFEFGTQSHTVITKEYPKPYLKDEEPYYPINDDKNNTLAHLYKNMAEKLPNFIFGGRLAEYRYYDMDQTIASALKKVNQEINARKYATEGT